MRLLVQGLALALLSAAAGAAGRKVDPGPWGGDRVILEVVADGANLEFECAGGHITGALELDADGDFDLPGTLSPESPGPTRDGDSGRSARYHGHVEGDHMTLTVTAGDETMGPYALTRDRRPILKKCR
jgi:hypothetical protein